MTIVLLAISALCFITAALGVLLMSTLAEVSTKLDTVLANVNALKAANATLAANQVDQAAVDALNAKADALVAASAPTNAAPTP